MGAAVVHDSDGAGPGILTERDILAALGNGLDPDRDGLDPDRECAGDHLTRDVVFAEPDWSVDEATDVMLQNNFRHLIATDGGEVIGVLSMRDVVRCWSVARALARA